MKYRIISGQDKGKMGNFRVYFGGATTKIHPETILSRIFVRLSSFVLLIAVMAACNFSPQNENNEQFEELNNTPQSPSDTIWDAPETSAPLLVTFSPISNPADEILLFDGTQIAAKQDGSCVVIISPGEPYLDQSIPDGTQIFPGQSFAKIWRLTNSGNCIWNKGYSVIWFSGSDLGLLHYQSLEEEVAPGESIDVSVEMRAPSEPGVYQSNWKLQSPNGDMYGIGPVGESPFWVRIEVIEQFTETPQPTMAPTPTPIVWIEGQCQLFLGDIYNFDTGAARQPGEDILFDLNDELNNVLVPINGTRLRVHGDQPPTFSDCMSASLSNEADPIAIVEGQYYCYRTSQGLPGRVRVVELNLEQLSTRLSYLTWSIP